MLEFKKFNNFNDKDKELYVSYFECISYEKRKEMMLRLKQTSFYYYFSLVITMK